MSDVRLKPVDPGKDVPATYQGQLAPNYYCRAWNGNRQKYCRSRAGTNTDHTGVGRCSKHGGNAKVRHGLLRRFQFHDSHIGELLEKFAAEPDPLNVGRELALARALLHDWVERYEANSQALHAWHAASDGSHIPLPEPEKAALLDVLDEYEALLKENEPTAEEVSKLELARSAVLFLATPQEARPRQVLDVSDAIKHTDVISKIIYRVEQVRTSGAISLDQLKRFLFAVERIIEVRVKDPELREKIAADILAIGV